MYSAHLSRAMGALAAAVVLTAGAACSDGPSAAPPAAAVQPAIPQSDVAPNDAQVSAVPCWYFSFKASGPLPNPARSGDNIRQNFGLINLGWDKVLHGAVVQSQVLYGGQIISSRVDFQPSSPDRARLLWTIPPFMPRGVYTVRVRANGGLANCATSQWITHPLIVQ